MNRAANLMHMPPQTVGEEKNALQDAQLQSDASSTTTDANSNAGKRIRTYPDDFPREKAGNGAQMPAPLASLINVEALLLASGGDILDTDVGSDLAPLPFSGTVLTSGVSDSPPDVDASANAPRGKAGGVDASSANVGPLHPLDILPKIEEMGDFDDFVRDLKSSMDPFVEEASSDYAAESSSSGMAVPTPESVLRSTTSRIASFLDETSRTLNTVAVQDLVVRASNALAIEQSATGMLKVANGVLVSGYVQGDGRGAAGVVRTTVEEERRRRSQLEENMFDSSVGSALGAAGTVVSPTDPLYSKPLFDDFPTARAVSPELSSSERRQTIAKAAEMACLSAAIYDDTLEESRAVGHSMVKRGVTGDVAWMVTDSLGYEEDFRDATDDAGQSSSGGSGSKSNGSGTRAESRTPIMVRTITIRGFDASDEDVDRERLLNHICTASPVTIGTSSASSKVLVHAGLLSVARELYNELIDFVDNAAPNHKLVLNGHSIGGSLSVLMLLIMAERRGADFVNDKVLRVFTFGSPPVAVHVGQDDNEQTQNGNNNSGDFSQNELIACSGTNGKQQKVSNRNSVDDESNAISCSVLSSFSLPVDLVYGFVQPWDPIVRLFSSVDPLYPLVEDVGEDGVSLYASGPNRALRPITRSIFESWDGWSEFRDNILDTPSPSFESVGVQHVMLPEPTRYLTDRLVGANLAVPPIDTVVRISSAELLPALVRTHPLDTFAISFVPAALRSFIHHFYPAYVDSFVEFAEGGGDKALGEDGTTGRANGEKLVAKKDSKEPTRDLRKSNERRMRAPPTGPGEIMEKTAVRERSQSGTGGSDSVADQKTVRERRGIVDWASASAQWVLGGNRVFGDDKEEKL